MVFEKYWRVIDIIYCPYENLTGIKYLVIYPINFSDDNHQYAEFENALEMAEFVKGIRHKGRRYYNFTDHMEKSIDNYVEGKKELKAV